MQLEDFLTKTEMSLRKFCDILGVHYNHFLQVYTGKRKLSDKMAEKVRKKTCGLVTKEEIIRKNWY